MSEVSIKIYNIQGKLVKTLSNDRIWGIGSHEMIWDGKSENGIRVGSGEYFYKLEAEGFREVKKMVLLK